jgi:Ca2+-binding EF-hand superfamily protein
MFSRTQSVTVVLALASGALAIGVGTAGAQRARDDGNLYQVQRGGHYDDWTIEGFRELDVDRNGRITAAEWRFDREDFRRADHDGDGVLTQREFLGESAGDDNATAGDRDDDDYASSMNDARFLDLDTNRDDRVSRDEWRSGRVSFDRLDENRDGYLTRAELAAPDASAADFTSLDADRNGVISRGEWLQSASSFERLDTNHDGRLTSTEYGAQRGTGTTTTVPRSPTTTTQSAAYRAGYERGMAEGRAAGREDRTRNAGWDLEGQRELEGADSGYRDALGSRAEYQAGYRAAFRIGYREGFGPR